MRSLVFGAAVTAAGRILMLRDWLTGATRGRCLRVAGRCDVPVMVVHGEGDRLFPVRMAEELAAENAGCALVVAPGLAHGDPVLKSRHEYWERIASFLVDAQAGS